MRSRCRCPNFVTVLLNKLVTLISRTRHLTRMSVIPHGYGVGYDPDMHELFEHTADLGLRITANELNTLFAEAAECLMTAIIEDLRSIHPRDEVRITIAGTDREYLLFDWLRELLARFDTDHMLFARFAVELGDDGLTASAWGEPFDPARHHLSHEVKAITYHELKVERTGDGWLAEVIVDI